VAACLPAGWRLPRLDSHQPADERFRGTPARVGPHYVAANAAAGKMPCIRLAIALYLGYNIRPSRMHQMG
jgi:hypothetical protein